MFCFLRAVYESFLNIRRTVCCVPFTYPLSWVNWVESGQVKVKAHIVQSLSLCYEVFSLPVQLNCQLTHQPNCLTTFALALVCEKKVFLSEVNCRFRKKDLRLSKILLSASFLMSR